MNESLSFYEQHRLESNFKPGINMTHVHIGLESYYDTYRIWRDYPGYLDQYQTGQIAISKINGHGFVKCYYKSITFIHWAFEFLCNDLLDACLPDFTKINIKDDQRLLAMLADGSIATATIGAKNIPSSVLRKRVKLLLENESILPVQFHIPTKYHFLKSYFEVLDLLATLRNEIVHQGKSILNIYTYECLFVNNLLPLIREYLKTEKRERLLERNLFCGMNAIDEIKSVRLPENYNDPANYEKLKTALRRINQFKELGRASYNNPLFMYEDVPEENKKMLSNINLRELEDAKDYGLFKQNTLGHYKIYKCPCCGADSLTTDQYWVSTSDDSVHVGRAMCSNCTYRIEENLGEPKEFGIMTEELFVYVGQHQVQ